MLPKTFRPKGKLSLRNVRTDVLEDYPAGWPEPGALDIEGFRYEQLIHEPLPLTDTERWAELSISWLRLHPGWVPGNYDQAAVAFQRMGRESDATEVLIAKQDDMVRLGQLSWARRMWYGLLGVTIRHGYQSERALLWLALFWGFGTLLFWYAWEQRLGRPLGDGEKPWFLALFYSLDTLLPVVDLQQDTHIQFSAETKLGEFVYWYQRFHTMIGWILSTLFAIGMSGLVRQWNKPPGSG